MLKCGWLFFKGLVVPVLRNVQDMDYADIEKGINALGQKAKANQLSIEVREVDKVYPTLKLLTVQLG